jgi:hypothetical protein
MSSSNLPNSSNIGWSKLSQRSKEKEYIMREVIGSGSFGEVEKCESQ